MWPELTIDPDFWVPVALYRKSPHSAIAAGQSLEFDTT